MYTKTRPVFFIIAYLDVAELQLHVAITLRARAPPAGDAGIDTRDMVRVVQAKGAGYAISRQQELETMQHVAQATGVTSASSNGRALEILTVYMD